MRRLESLEDERPREHAGRSPGAEHPPPNNTLCFFALCCRCGCARARLPPLHSSWSPVSTLAVRSLTLSFSPSILTLILFLTLPRSSSCTLRLWTCSFAYTGANTHRQTTRANIGVQDYVQYPSFLSARSQSLLWLGPCCLALAVDRLLFGVWAQLQLLNPTRHGALGHSQCESVRSEQRRKGKPAGLTV